MPSDEDLYEEIRQLEQTDDQLYRQSLAARELEKVKRKEVDTDEALFRFRRDIAPVLETRKRIQAGRPITDSPVRNAWLWLTRRNRIIERPGFEIIEPTRGMEMIPPKEKP